MLETALVVMSTLTILPSCTSWSGCSMLGSDTKQGCKTATWTRALSKPPWTISTTCAQAPTISLSSAIFCSRAFSSSASSLAIRSYRSDSGSPTCFTSSSGLEVLISFGHLSNSWLGFTQINLKFLGIVDSIFLVLVLLGVFLLQTGELVVGLS